MKNKKNNKTVQSSNNNDIISEIREKGSAYLSTTQKKSEVELIANQNFIQFLSEDSNEKIDLLILYNNLVIFAFEKNDKYLLFNYSNDLEEESNTVKFYPEEKDKSNKKFFM